MITSNNACFLVSPTLIRSSILPWLFQLSEVYVNSQFPSRVLLWLSSSLCFFVVSLPIVCLNQNCAALLLWPWTLQSKVQEVLQ